MATEAATYLTLVERLILNRTKPPFCEEYDQYNPKRYKAPIPQLVSQRHISNRNGPYIGYTGERLLVKLTHASEYFFEQDSLLVALEYVLPNEERLESWEQTVEVASKVMPDGILRYQSRESCPYVIVISDLRKRIITKVNVVNLGICHSVNEGNEAEFRKLVGSHLVEGIDRFCDLVYALRKPLIRQKVS